MKHILTATALSTLLLIGCSQESSDPTISNPADETSTTAESIQESTSTTEEIQEPVDISTLPARRTGSVQIFERDGGYGVVGYSMSQPDGIRTIEVLLNDEPAGIATYNKEEQLAKRFDDFYDPNKPNVGFEYQIDTSKLNAGEYNVTIKATTVNGAEFVFGNNRDFIVE